MYVTSCISIQPIYVVTNTICFVFTAPVGGQSFIFSLSNKDNLPPFKSNLRRNKTPIVKSSHHGVIFGKGNDSNGRDISISNYANRGSTSFSDFGNAYTLPGGYVAESNEARCLLAGSFNFTPTEVEVFH